MPSWLATISLTCLSALVVTAQVFPIPKDLVGVSCDGTIRPNYEECYKDVLPQTFNVPIIVGPSLFEGTTFVSGKCKIRAVRCSGPTDSSFDLGGELTSSMFDVLRNQCGDFPAGGVNRQGDACLVVETPTNSFPGKRDLETSQLANLTDTDALSARAVSPQESRLRTARRDVVARELEERQCNPGGPCFTYVEQTFITGVRGFGVRVCETILPNGGTCGESRSATTSQTFTVGVEISTGIEGIVEASGSFSSATGKSSTETISTDIKVDCPGGSGYVVWYPLMVISRGECGEGTGTCGAGCLATKVGSCEMRKPITAGPGVLSGEYAVQCI